VTFYLRASSHFEWVSRSRHLAKVSSQLASCTYAPGRHNRTQMPPRVSIALSVLALLFLSTTPQASCASELALPDAPKPQLPDHAAPSATPCQLKNAGARIIYGANFGMAAAAGLIASESDPDNQSKDEPFPCGPRLPIINWYARFLNGPQVKPLTPREKAQLAARNLLDPFNLVTILADAGISVGSNAHSAYGPAMTGFGRYVGVSFTQDMTGEFFGTFLIPSLVHQDPHYHRMPNAAIPRRVGHAIEQVVWTQGDDGSGMVNYANLAAFAIGDAIGNLYVPGRETSFSASAQRYAIGLATAPIDNFITEFVPDVARRIHVRVVLVQRIINKVAKTDGAGQQ